MATAGDSTKEASAHHSSDDDKPCTPDKLMDIITADSGGIVLMPSNAFDEVYPNLYLGEESIAKSRVGLKELGITHILNSAQGKTNFHVNINREMFQRVGMEYYGIEAMDQMNFKLAPFFQKAADFIEKGLLSGGKVMVNCKVGGSRSATLVIAYLMIKQNMTVQQAMRSVRPAREICPNEGFLEQLCDLDNKLRKSGHYKQNS